MSTHIASRNRSATHRTDNALTDRELLLREFDAADPESLEGITTDPQSDGEPAVEFSYDLRARGRKARCVYCKWENHFEGVVIRYPSGERALVGRDCAIQRHGADFSVLLNDFDAARDRQSCLRRKNTVLAKWRRLLDELGDLAAHPAILLFDQLRREWRDIMGSMFPGLAEAADAEAPCLTRRVRDIAAEDRRASELFGLSGRARRKAERRGDVDPIFTGQVDNLGPLRGAAFFRADASMASSLRAIEAGLQAILRRLNGDGMSTHAMRAGLVSLGDCEQMIAAEMARLATLSDAFEPANLSRIALYANSRAQVERPQEPPLPDETLAMRRLPASRPVGSFGRFHASQRAFHRTAGAETWTVELPAWFKVPQPAVLGTLRRVLAG